MENENQGDSQISIFQIQRKEDLFKSKPFFKGKFERILAEAKVISITRGTSFVFRKKLLRCFFYEIK